MSRAAGIGIFVAMVVALTIGLAVYSRQAENTLTKSDNPIPTRQHIETLLSNPGKASTDEIVSVYGNLDISTRRLIERQAVEKDADLKSAIVNQASGDVSSKDIHAQIKALESLRFMKAAGSEPKAIEIVKTSSSPELKCAAINYLGSVNSIDAFDTVLSTADNSSSPVDIKATAIRNVVLVGGRNHPDETVAVLAKCLKDKDLTVKTEVIYVLGRFPDKITPDILKDIEEIGRMRGQDPKTVQTREALLMLLDQLKATGSLEGK